MYNDTPISLGHDKRCVCVDIQIYTHVYNPSCVLRSSRGSSSSSSSSIVPIAMKHYTHGR